MSNVIFANFKPVTTTNAFNILWKLSRAMKKAGWIYKSSGNGSSKDTSGNAANDLWGANTDPANDTYSPESTVSTGAQTLPTATLNATNPQTAGFPTSGTLQVATSTNGWQTVTYTGTNTTSFTGCTGGTGTVPAGSAIGGGAINMDTVAGWWNAQGPSTLKIPINTPLTPGIDGYFMRGETVSQATSGAQGEIIGYIYDGYFAQGFLVVMPRIDGYGADPHGWDHTHVITGLSSGASVTPSATVVEFVREISFWKGTTTNLATTYMQCVDGYGENTQRLSVLAGSAGCTASIGPGGGGTGNAFPTIGTYTAGGTGGSQAGSEVFVNNIIPSGSLGRAQIIAVNASYSATTSADGSFLVTAAYNGTPFPPNYETLWGYCRTDNQEDGDVDPYVFYTPSADGSPQSVTITAGSNGATLPQATINISSTAGFSGTGGGAYIISSNGPQYVTYTSTAGGNQITGCSGGTGTLSTGNFATGGPLPSAKFASTNNNTQTQTMTGSWNTSTGNLWFRMLRRRGFATSDTVTNGVPSILLAGASQGATTAAHHTASYYDREKLANSFSDTYIGDFIWAVSIYAGLKIRKGTLRWVRIGLSDVNTSYGFNNSKNWISISAIQSPTSLTQGSIIIGPWDGYTTPTPY